MGRSGESGLIVRNMTERISFNGELDRQNDLLMGTWEEENDWLLHIIDNKSVNCRKHSTRLIHRNIVNTHHIWVNIVQMQVNIQQIWVNSLQL